MFWIYFRGTKNGEYIEAETMQAAKWIMAYKHGLRSISYIAGRRIYRGLELRNLHLKCL